jgi:AP2 domain
MTASEYDLVAPPRARVVALGGAKAAGRVALVSESDFSTVCAYRWHVQHNLKPDGTPSNWYAITTARRGSGRVCLYMHQVLTGFGITDHINHDGLDNRRENLREATASQNVQNRRPQEGTSSRFKGVYFDPRRRNWRARIRIQKTKVSLGCFALEADAARAYDRAAAIAFGEFACTNFPVSDYAKQEITAA